VGCEGAGEGLTLLAEVRLPFLTVAITISPRPRGQAIEAPLDAVHGHDEQVLGPRVIGAVQDSAHGQTQRDAEFGASGRSSCTRRAGGGARGEGVRRGKEGERGPGRGFEGAPPSAKRSARERLAPY